MCLPTYLVSKYLGRHSANGRAPAPTTPAPGAVMMIAAVKASHTVVVSAQGNPVISTNSRRSAISCPRPRRMSHQTSYNGPSCASTGFAISSR